MLKSISITEESKGKQYETWVPGKDEQKRKLYFDDLFTSVMIPYRRQYEDVWRDAYDIHDQIAESEFDDGRTNIVLPLSAMLIETKLAEELENRPDIYFEAQTEEDVPKVPILEDIIKRHVWEKSYMDDRLYEAFYEKNLYGQSWLSPQYIKRKKFIKEPYLEKGTLQYKEREVVCENDIYVKLYRNDKVWTEPVRDIRDAGYCVLEDDYSSYDSFLADFGDDTIYKNLKYVQPGTIYYTDANRIVDYNTPDELKRDRIVVLHFYHKFKNEYCIWANGVEIYYGKMPYDHGELPLVQFINRYRPDSLYHKGETELCAGLFALLTSIFNTSIDALKYAISPLLVIPNGSNFNQDEIIARPGMVIKANIDGFKQLQLGNVPREAVELRETLLDFISWSTGINIRQMVGEPVSTTATVAALRKESLAKRINLGLRLNEGRAFKRLGEQLVALVQQYYTEPMIESIVGEEAMKEIDEEKKEEKKYRPIKVRGKKFKETKNKNGEYDLEEEKLDKDEYSFFQARPEYILTKKGLDVIVRPGSTVAVSQMLEQRKAKEAIQMALSIPPQPDEKGQPQPMLNLKYLIGKYIDTLKYDQEKAFGKEKTDEESVEEIMSKNGMGKVNPMMPSPGGTPPMPAPAEEASPLSQRMPGRPPESELGTAPQMSGASQIGNIMGEEMKIP